MRAFEVYKSQFVILVGQNSVNYYIQMVVVALLSVVLVGFVILVTVILVVNCIWQGLLKAPLAYSQGVIDPYSYQAPP